MDIFDIEKMKENLLKSLEDSPPNEPHLVSYSTFKYMKEQGWIDSKGRIKKNFGDKLKVIK